MKIFLIILGIILLFIFIAVLFTRYKMEVYKVISITDNSNENKRIVLEPCPFCGQNKEDLITEVLKDENGTEVTMYSICCKADEGGCGSMTGLYNKPIDAVMAWNKRAYE